jgi:hypothetical protein
MITGSNLFGLAVTYRSRLTQFSKLIYATVVSKVLLQNLYLRAIAGFDVISNFALMAIFERFFWKSKLKIAPICMWMTL